MLQTNVMYCTLDLLFPLHADLWTIEVSELVRMFEKTSFVPLVVGTLFPLHAT